MKNSNYLRSSRREVELCLINLYLYNLVPDRTMSSSIPEGNVFVMSTSKELRFRGMDSESPKLVSVTLQEQKCFL